MGNAARAVSRRFLFSAKPTKPGRRFGPAARRPEGKTVKLKEAVEKEKKNVFITYRRTPVLIVRGRGAYVYDSEGKRYLDFLTGLAVNSLGHCNARVAAAVSKQIKTLSHVSNLYYTEPMLLLAERLTGLAKMDKIFFSNSGAEANEAAIKIVRRYHSEILKDGRYEIICFNHAFHGRTLGTLAATGTALYKQGFDPAMPGFKHAEFNDLKSVEKLITKKTAAIMIEPIQGEAGVYPADPKFMRGLDALRKKHGIQLIFDEVQCGLGRTGKWFAYEHYRVKPDVITIAKAIGGGLPLGAMMARGKVAEAFVPGAHATTFGAGPVVCAAGLAVLDEIESRGLLENAARIGNYITSRLCELKKKYPEIKEIRGKGLMIGVEFDGDAPEAAGFFRERGMLINAIRKNIIRILPPYTTTEKQADVFVRLFAEFLEKSRGGKGACK